MAELPENALQTLEYMYIRIVSSVMHGSFIFVLADISYMYIKLYNVYKISGQKVSKMFLVVKYFFSLR